MSMRVFSENRTTSVVIFRHPTPRTLRQSPVNKPFRVFVPRRPATARKPHLPVQIDAFAILGFDVGREQHRPHRGRIMKGRTAARAFAGGQPETANQKEDSKLANKKPPDTARSTRNYQPIALSGHARMRSSQTGFVLSD